jgi:hypothetical protein
MKRDEVHLMRSHSPQMFMVSEQEAASIRDAFDQGGEISASVELRRLFPGLVDNQDTRECARAIAGWKPLAMPEKPRVRRKRD